MREASVIQTRHAKDLPALISGTLASLLSFRDMQDKAHDSSVRLGSEYGAISDSFKKLIVSIQFHDITRQQVEHVIEVLQRLSSESGDEGRSTSRRSRGVSAVLALQSAQLADAGEKFATSVLSVERNLEDIAGHVLEMVDESRALSGLRKDEKGSFFLPMEQDCRAILTRLGDTANAEAATRVIKMAWRRTSGECASPFKRSSKLSPRCAKWH